MNLDELAPEDGNKINILTFSFSRTCSPCADEATFLKNLKQKDPDLNVTPLEISRENAIYVIQNASKIMDLDQKGIPITVIGGWSLAGFKDTESTGKLIESEINNYRNKEKSDYIHEILIRGGNRRLLSDKELLEISDKIKAQKAEFVTAEESIPTGNTNHDYISIKLPFIGVIDLTNSSLITITSLYGLVDGFSPCDLWTYLFFFAFLICLKNNKSRGFLGSVFLLVSGILYFLIFTKLISASTFVNFISAI